MTVCFFNNLFGATARGGAERVVAEEAFGLVAAGHDVTVFSSCRKGEEKVVTHDGFVERTVAVWNFFWYGDLARHSWFSRLAWHIVDIANVVARQQLKKILMDLQPDVVHTHNIMGLGFLLPRLLKRIGVRHVHTVHDVQLLHPSGLIVSGVGHRGYQVVMRWIIGSPDVVLFPSQFLADAHERAGFFRKSQKVVVWNPVSVVQARNNEHVVVDDERKIRFLFVGQLEPHKGVVALIDAWQAWTTRPADATLDIIGSGSLEDWTRSVARDDRGIYVHGKKDRHQIFSFFAKAKYVVAPSLVIENAPAVIGESFSVGVPVIASRVGGIPEFVRDNETGFLCEAGNTQDMVRAFDRAISALDVWGTLSTNVRNVAVSFSLEKHIEQVLTCYRN